MVNAVVEIGINNFNKYDPVVFIGSQEVIMPRGDRTGPDGFGPMTGRNLGYCNGYDSPGFTKGTPRGGAVYRSNRNWGRGSRFGGRMRLQQGYDQPYYPASSYSAQDETKILENEVIVLKDQLKALETRLSELKKDE